MTTPSPGGGRHLKRLSLSNSISSPSSSPHSPASPFNLNLSRNSNSTPSPSTVHGTPPRSSQPRALRLSTSSSGVERLSFESRDSPSFTSRSHLLDAHTPSSAPADVPSFDNESPTTSRRLPSSAGPNGSFSRSAHHAKRMSSISYSSSHGEAADQQSPSPISGLVRSHSLNSPLHSPSTSISSRHRSLNGSVDSSASVVSPSRDRFQPTPPPGSLQELKEEEEEETSSPTRDRRIHPTASDLETVSPAVRTGPTALGAQPTLTELHSDLLSFIAKKERRCLDLREELKRHESELTHLKKKWEAIVAKSLASPSPPTTTSFPRPSSGITSLTSPPFPPSARPPRSPNTQHTLDLSLLSSTFDQPSYNEDGKPSSESELDKEIGESVQAAKAWVGGVLGKVMDAVSGIEEPLRPGASGLQVLKEEDEDDDSHAQRSKGDKSSPGGASAASASSADDRRRDSRTSTISTTSDLSDGSSFGFAGVKRTAASEEGTMATTYSHGSSSTSSIFSLSGAFSSDPRPPSPESVRASTLSRASRPPPSSSSSAAASAEGHNRRRSTFDILGSAAGGGWSSLGKKWAQVAESDTFKGTKRATLNFVDTFERTLTETLGPLDPPLIDTSTSSSSSAQSPSATLASAITPTASTFKPGETDRTPKARADAEWDWSSFLEGSTDSPSTASATKIGGYRRPSLTPSRNTSSSGSTTVEDPAKTRSLSPQNRLDMSSSATTSVAPSKSTPVPLNSGVLLAKSTSSAIANVPNAEADGEEDEWGW